MEDTVTEQPTYVYGVLSADARAPQIAGIGAAPLREVASDGVAALVSDLADRELVFGRDQVTTHARVLEQTLEHATVLPMRFGVVMEGDTAVKEHLLDAHHDELIRQLDELRGKVELRVRAVYEEEQVMREVLMEDLEIQRLRDRLRDAPDDATYYGRIQLGELVANALEHKRAADAARILEALEPFALASHVGEPANERIVISGSFLVEHQAMATFDEVVDALGRAHAGRIRIKYTGPLPPHSFVNLNATEA